MKESRNNTNLKESLFYKRGTGAIKDLLTLSDCGMVIVDLDDTTKESKKHMWADGKQRKLLPETVNAFLAISLARVKIGIATEQSFKEIYPFISDISTLATGYTDPHKLFTGILVGEGGSVVDTGSGNEITVAPSQSIKDIARITEWLKTNIIPLDNSEWSILNGTDPVKSTFVQLPPDEDLCTATISLWEKGPHISQDPSYIEKYTLIEKTVRTGLNELNIESLTTYEAGNGTLRITPRFINKAHSLSLLGAFGLFKPSNSVYFCDGPNDVRLAEELKLKGGYVIAVSNAVPKLHEISDYSSSLPAGSGFAEAISAIFPEEYQKASKLLSDKGIQLLE